MFNLNFVHTYFANSLDPLIPEVWANESLAVLEDNIVAASRVHRDFEGAVARFGDTVNTRQPGTFVAKRMALNDDVTDQNATAVNVPVILNQRVHVSFLLRDGEQTMAFKDLVTEYLDPAMKAQARFLDQIVLGQTPQFLSNAVGGLGSISSSNVKDRVLAVRGKMNTNKVPDVGRNLIWTSNSETEALKVDSFLLAQNVGDNGSALQNATLGRKLGFDNYMSQLMSSVPTTAVSVTTGAVNNASGHAVGDTSITVDGFSAAIAVGKWVTIDGQPYRVAGTTGGSTPTVITIPSPGLRAAVADNAVVKVIGAGAVNFAAGYAAGYEKEITYDGVTGTLCEGQMVSFGLSATSAIYTIVTVTSTTIVLDRPLEAALSDNDVMNIGPAGDYNLAFHKNAIALVVRPLALVGNDGSGARSAVVNYNGLSMRAVISYDTRASGTRVMLDMLCGVKVLNSSLGAVMLG